jgi:hypothetical protein
MPSSTRTHLDADGVNGLFEGVVEPCDVAYLDLFLNNLTVDPKCVSMSNTEDQSYSETAQDYILTQTHELKYKGEVVWRIETTAKDEYRSTCELINTGLQMNVTIESLDAVKGKTLVGDSWTPLRETRKFDTESLIRASATAYQMYAVEEEVGFQHQALNHLPEVVPAGNESGSSAPLAPINVQETPPAPINVEVAPPAHIIVEMSDDDRDDDATGDSTSELNHQPTPPTSDDVEKGNDVPDSRSIMSNKSTESSVRLNANEVDHDNERTSRRFIQSRRIRLEEDDDELSTEQDKTTAVSFGFFDIDFEVFKQFLR